MHLFSLFIALGFLSMSCGLAVERVHMPIGEGTSVRYYDRVSSSGWWNSSNDCIYPMNVQFETPVPVGENPDKIGAKVKTIQESKPTCSFQEGPVNRAIGSAVPAFLTGMWGYLAAKVLPGTDIRVTGVAGDVSPTNTTGVDVDSTNSSNVTGIASGGISVKSEGGKGYGGEGGKGGAGGAGGTGHGGTGGAGGVGGKAEIGSGAAVATAKVGDVKASATGGTATGGTASATGGTGTGGTATSSPVVSPVMTTGASTSTATSSPSVSTSTPVGVDIGITSTNTGTATSSPTFGGGW